VEAFDRPRFHVARARVKGEASNVIDLEADNPPAMDAELESVGYQVARHPRNGHYFGGGSAVAFTEDGLQAVADLRRTNHAAGE
jgi:gamma-glutamyltranspeptidase